MTPTIKVAHYRKFRVGAGVFLIADERIGRASLSCGDGLASDALLSICPIHGIGRGSSAVNVAVNDSCGHVDALGGWIATPIEMSEFEKCCVRGNPCGSIGDFGWGRLALSECREGT